MKILMLSLDQGLLTPGKSDTQLRFEDYSRFYDLMKVIVPGIKSASWQVNGKLSITGVNGNPLSRFISVISKGIELCRLNKIDLIVANEPTIGLAGWLIKLFTGAKLNVNVLGLEIDNPVWLNDQKILHSFLKQIQIFVLKNSDTVRSDSKKAAKDLIHLGITPSKITFIPVIPSKQSIERLKKINAKKASSRGKVNLLAIGYLIPQKGYDVLLCCLQRVQVKFPSVQLVIVGDGPQRRHLDVLAKQLNVEKNVQFIGNVDYKKLPDYYARGDIFVSSSWFEGGPRVIMEAAFCSMPIVSTDVGSVADMFQGKKSVVLIPPGDSKKMAEKVLELLNNSELQKSLGQNARTQIEKYCNYDQNTSQLINLWLQTSKM